MNQDTAQAAQPPQPTAAPRAAWKTLVNDAFPVGIVAMLAAGMLQPVIANLGNSAGAGAARQRANRAPLSVIPQLAQPGR